MRNKKKQFSETESFHMYQIVYKMTLQFVYIILQFDHDEAREIKAF